MGISPPAAPPATAVLLSLALAGILQSLAIQATQNHIILNVHI